MPTLGHTTADVTGSDNNPTATVLVSLKATTDAQGGLCGTMWQYFQGYGGGTGTNQKFRGIIYQANGASASPGTLTGVTDELAFGAGVAGWQQFATWTNFGGAPMLAAATAYWLGLWFGPSDGTAFGFVNGASGAGTGMYYNTTTTYSTTANPGAVTWTNLGSGNMEYDTYVDYISPAQPSLSFSGGLRKRMGSAPRPRPFRPGSRR
jgi:hypothetical protein